MKWFVVLVVCLGARCAEGGASGCFPGEESSCLQRKLEKGHPVAIERSKRDTSSLRSEGTVIHDKVEDSSMESKSLLQAPKTAKTNTTKQVCVANRMFIRDCNTCWCNEDGTSFFCTRRVCVPELPEDVDDKLEEFGTIKKECRPDEVFELDCNMCRCNADGKSYSCTRRACVEPVVENDKLRIIKKECRPDEVFELDCNMCRCNADGKSYSCTRRACVEPVDENDKVAKSRRRRVSQQERKICQPGQEFRMDCNTCLCDNDGQQFSCTRIDCAQVYKGGREKRDVETTENVTMQCVPGSVFDRQCNACRCASDGQRAVCTNKRCPSLTQTAESTTPEPGTDPNFRCNPGEQFKRDCNDCQCSADGRSVFCTVRYCDNDISPNPSSAA